MHLDMYFGSTCGLRKHLIQHFLNTAHVGILYPAFFNSSVRLVSFRIVAISTCSWPSQHSCFFGKFHPPLVILHPRPGSRHAIRPSVVMSLVSSTRPSNTYDESRILMKPPAGISWSRNQFFPITSGFSCPRRRPGSYADVGIEGASHRMLLCMNSEPFLSIGLLTTSGCVCSRSLLQHTRFSSEIKSVIAGAK